METKLFELRDSGTFIVICCTGMVPTSERERRLLWRSGFHGGPTLVLLSDVNGGRKSQYDPYAWGDRTFATAHKYIEEHWHDLSSGDVVDVEFILGESGSKKASEVNP